MKLSIKQKVLMEHLNYVIRGISSKNLIPILNCIKFELTSEGLYLLSTDNELAIKSFIPASEIDNIEIQGELLISGRYIYIFIIIIIKIYITRGADKFLFRVRWFSILLF